MGNDTTQTVEHLTPAELDALLEAARAASPSPWRYLPSDGFIVGPGYRSTVAQTWSKLEEDFDNEKANGKFIAAANPTTIERLVLMVRELQTQLEWSSSANQLLEGAVSGTSQFTIRAIEHFRARAVRVLRKADYEDLTRRAIYRDQILNPSALRWTGYELAQLIESLPLVETEE